tara:strand:+ start:5330 stop:6472 length:1143 start_codon:yes stop_codon:yes gene_type:complete
MLNNLFKDLFVLELANNHWGNLERGLKIVRDFSSIVKHNNVKAAIKLQIRDVDSFIHPDHIKHNSRYIKKTIDTKMTFDQYKALVDEIKNTGCIPMATPFDEKSVDTCLKLELPILKIASSDANDWPLIEKVASTGLPTIVSNGGLSEKDLDDIVEYFAHRSVPLAINHCVSQYPTEEHNLNLDQIDYLVKRYPDNVIGHSTHEYHDWSNSMLVSYAKGARSWERHIDIEYTGKGWEGKSVSPYCSTPKDIDTYFQAYHKSREICGGVADQKRVIPKNEIEYLDELVRGIYARKDIKKGTKINHDNFNDYFFLAVPLMQGQLSCREIINNVIIQDDIKSNQPLDIESIDGPYNDNFKLKKMIQERGFKNDSKLSKVRIIK